VRGAEIISSTTIRKITIKQQSSWDTVQHKLKYEVQYGCKADTYHSAMHETPRAKQSSQSQPSALPPAWTLPAQKRRGAAGKPKEAQQEGSEA